MAQEHIFENKHMFIDKRTDVFKNNIGYQDALDKESVFLIKEIELPDLSVIKPIKDWTLSDKRISQKSDRSNSIQGRLTSTFEQGENKPSVFIKLTVYLSENGYEDARNNFLITASSTTMSYIPYIRGPKNLGTISAMTKTDSSVNKNFIFWIYGNVYFEVASVNMSYDMTCQISKWLQQYVENQINAN